MLSLHGDDTKFAYSTNSWSKKLKRLTVSRYMESDKARCLYYNSRTEPANFARSWDFFSFFSFLFFFFFCRKLGFAINDQLMYLSAIHS